MLLNKKTYLKEVIVMNFTENIKKFVTKKWNNANVCVVFRGDGMYDIDVFTKSGLRVYSTLFITDAYGIWDEDAELPDGDFCFEFISQYNKNRKLTKDTYINGNSIFYFYYDKKGRMKKEIYICNRYKKITKILYKGMERTKDFIYKYNKKGELIEYSTYKHDVV
jgi:hypothetical protein